MAKLKFGIFGPLSGKLGAVVGGTWKGIPYLKKAPVLKKSAVRSPAQIQNQKKFKYVNDWLIPFHPFITIGFENLAIGKTALSAAFSLIYNTVFTGVMPNLVIDHTKMVISSGPLIPLANVSINFTSGRTLKLVWKSNYGQGARFDDQVTIALFSTDLHMADGFIAAVSRAAEQHSFSIDEELIGKQLHGYLFLSSISRKAVSETLYLGIIEPL